MYVAAHRLCLALPARGLARPRALAVCLPRPRPGRATSPPSMSRSTCSATCRTASSASPRCSRACAASPRSSLALGSAARAVARARGGAELPAGARRLQPRRALQRRRRRAAARRSAVLLRAGAAAGGPLARCARALSFAGADIDFGLALIGAVALHPAQPGDAALRRRRPARPAAPRRAAARARAGVLRRHRGVHRGGEPRRASALLLSALAAPAQPGARHDRRRWSAPRWR